MAAAAAAERVRSVWPNARVPEHIDLEAGLLSYDLFFILLCVFFPPPVRTRHDKCHIQTALIITGGGEGGGKKKKILHMMVERGEGGGVKK